jgi:type IV pilus assembly protein PilX
MRLHRKYASATEIRGAALATSLLLLLVMTVLAIGASHAVRMQAEFAAQARDEDLAFERAEAALRAAERRVGSPDIVTPPVPCGAGRCTIYGSIDPATIGNPLAPQSEAWWKKYGWRYEHETRPAGKGKPIDAAASMNPPPLFVLEEYGESLDSLAISPTGPPPRRVVYQVSAVAESGTARSIAVLQSRFARRFE